MSKKTQKKLQFFFLLCNLLNTVFVANKKGFLSDTFAKYVLNILVYVGVDFFCGVRASFYADV